MAPVQPPLRAVPRNPVPGPHNRQAEDEPARLHCLLDEPGMQFTTSGRAAILLGLEALGLAPTDRVLVPSYHCPTMVSPAIALGQPVGFYPIDASGRPSIEWLEQHAPADTRVLCAAHYFGLPLDLRPIKAWCDARGVLMLEDCAHAMFGQGPGGPVGALGDVVIASLPKFFATQEGGLLRLRDARHPAPALRRAGAVAELKAWFDTLEISASHDRLGHWGWWARPLLAAKHAVRRAPAPASAAPAAPEGFDPAGNYARIDMALSHRAPCGVTVDTAVHSTRGRVTARRRHHYQALVAAVSGRAGVRALFPELPAQAAPYVMPLWVDQPDPAYRSLRERGVPVSRWDWLWPGVPDMAGDQGKTWSHHVLQVHCHQDMTDEDRDWVIGSVLALCER